MRGSWKRCHFLFESVLFCSVFLLELASPSAEDRLPKSLRFAESDVIIFVVRASGVHELGYGHKWDWEA
jgi:hypothetical protein